MAQRDLLLKSKAPDATGRVHHITPDSAGMGPCRLRPLSHSRTARRIAVPADGREHCLVLVGGHADVTAGNETFRNIGERAFAFRRKGALFGLRPGGCCLATLTAIGDLELAVCSAPGQDGGSPRCPASSGRRMSAMRNAARAAMSAMSITSCPETAAADSLLVVEVVTPGGNWSSYPPHKHDTSAAPQETKLEETYYHRLNPPQGFAFQRVYTDDRSIDQTMAVENGDRGDGAGRLSPGRRAPRLRPLLSQRDGRSGAALVLQERPAA